MHHVEVEEQQHQDQGNDGADANDLHGEVALGAQHLTGSVLLATNLLHSQSDSTLDDAPRLDDAYDTCHGDATDTYATGIVGKDLLRAHQANRRGDGGVPLIEDHIAPKEVHAWHDDKPYGQGACSDDRGIAQAYDVT